MTNRVKRRPITRRLRVTTPETAELRVLDLFAPLGKGQRGVIVSPPRAGKTTLLTGIARGLARNHPECHVAIFLPGQRPEDVTEVTRAVAGTTVEVVPTGPDDTPAEAVRGGRDLLDRVQRLAAEGGDAVLLIDPINPFVRALLREHPASPRFGAHPPGFKEAKKFFHSAGEVEGGGSLTILAAIEIDTGSKLDDVTFQEEFKGAGDVEVYLDRRLAEAGVWPAIDLSSSGSRRAGPLRDADETDHFERLWPHLSEMHPLDAMRCLRARLREPSDRSDPNLKVKGMGGGMSDETAFLGKILEDPEDDVPRLVYADWLQDHGDDDRAEFIRAHVRAVALPGRHPDRGEAESRAAELLAEHRAEWTAPLTALGVKGAGLASFDRGILDRVGVGLTALLSWDEHWVRPMGTLQRIDLTVEAAERAEIPRLAEVGWFDRLRGLTCNGCSWGDELAGALAGNGALRGLRSLDLEFTGLTDAGVRALAGSPSLAGLRSLSLMNNHIGPESARALAGSPHTANLRVLFIGVNDIGDDGARAIAGSPHLTRLTTLDLYGSGIGPDGIAALAASPNLASVTSLTLSGEVTEAAARVLAESPHLGGLTRLNLSSASIGPDALRLLTQAAWWGGLCDLDPGANRIGDTLGTSESCPEDNEFRTPIGG